MGVDPGVTGGVAFLTDEYLLRVERMPILAKQVDVDEIARFLYEEQPDIVAIERLSARPRGSIASWSLAWNTSAVEATCTALGYPLVRLLPSGWRKAVGLPNKSTKGDSRLLAKQLWPDLSDSFRLVRDDGLAEAALIAEAHRRKNQ